MWNLCKFHLETRESVKFWSIKMESSLISNTAHCFCLSTSFMIYYVVGKRSRVEIRSSRKAPTPFAKTAVFAPYFAGSIFDSLLSYVAIFLAGHTCCDISGYYMHNTIHSNVLLAKVLCGFFNPVIARNPIEEETRFRQLKRQSGLYFINYYLLLGRIRRKLIIDATKSLMIVFPPASLWRR